MAESPEWLNQRIFAVLARFIPHLDEKAPIERLQSIFPHFRDCLRKILAEESVCEEFYLLKCRLLFGRIVHSLLFIFEQKRNDKSIRLESAQLLSQLFNPTRRNCSETASVAFVLPGVVTKCSLLVRSEATSQFVEPALEIICKIVCSVFNNHLVDKLLKSPDFEEDNQLSLQRDAKFFETNAEKIVESFQLLVKHVANTQSERDRQSLLELIEEVWGSCETTFISTKLFQLRLQLVVRFAFDEWESIRSKANNAICDLNAKFADRVFDQAKASITSSVTNVLQQKANSLDSLQTIAHFLNILNRKQMRQLFKPQRKDKNLLKRLGNALELTVNVDLKRVVACELNSQEKDMFVSIPLRETIKSEYLNRTLVALVQNGMGKTFFRSVANSLRSNPRRIHSALILAHLCNALTRQQCDLHFTILIQNHIVFVWLKHLERFLEQEPDPSNSDPTETSSLWHTRESAFCCALLATVAYSMQLMNPKGRDFQRLIVDVLYTVLQFLPSTNMVCASAAHVALEIIANTCDQSVDEFLSENADKVVYKAAMQARNLWKYPRSPFALAALLDRGYGHGMVDELAHLIPEILIGISTEDSARIVPCLKAMHSFVLALTRWFPDLLQAKPKEPMIENENAEQSHSSDSESDQEEAGDTNDSHWQRLEKLRDKFEKLRQQNDETLEQKREKQHLRPVSNDEKAEPPKLIKCVHRILERIQHLHHSPFPYTRLLLADLLRDALRFIRQFDDQLLPMIHQNWVPMSISMRRTLRQVNQRTQVQSLSAPDKLIVAAELRTVACMCQVAGNFLYSKIVNELDEPLQVFMQTSVKLSQRTAAVYSHSASFKVQATILECWPIYCELARISTDRACQILQLYANDAQQNVKLRELATQGLNAIGRIRHEE